MKIIADAERRYEDSRARRSDNKKPVIEGETQTEKGGDNLSHNLFGITQCRKNISNKIRGSLSNAETCRIADKEFAESKRHTLARMLLTKNKRHLGV